MRIIEQAAGRCTFYLVLLVMAWSGAGCVDPIYTQEVRVISHRRPRLQIDTSALPAGWEADVEETSDDRITTVNMRPKQMTPVSEWDVPFKVVIEPITQSSRLDEPHNPHYDRGLVKGLLI
jgi:hypothetical protein